jgi:hypothetical protein
MTVSGGVLKEGGPAVGLTSFDPNNPPEQVVIGTSPLNVIVIYVPIDGNGPAGVGSGATIDQFDQTIGQLIDDTSPTDVDFVGWVTLSTPATVSTSPNLEVGAQQSVSAPAFYQAPTGGSVIGIVFEDTEGECSNCQGPRSSLNPRAA